MKKKIFIFTLSVIIISLSRTSNSQSGWQSVATFSNSIHDVKFFSINKVLIAGENKIHLSTDGGFNWATQTIAGNGQTFYEICIIDSLIGYVSGFNSALFKTTNAGSNWIQLNPEFGHFQTVSFLNYKNGIIAGAIGYAATTTNGGLNWIRRQSFINTSFHGSVYVSPSTCILIGDSTVPFPGWVYKTIQFSSDDGNSWLRVFSSPGGSLRGVNFLNSSTGMAVGSQIILKTNNGGISWTQQNFSDVTFNRVCYLDGNKIYVVGFAGLIMRSTNGGNNWQTQNSGTASHIWGIDFYNEQTGIAVSTFQVLRTTNGGLTSVFENTNFIPSSYSLSQNYPNPFNPSTIINYELPITNYVSLIVYDLLGKEVANLVNQKLNAGSYSVEFDGANEPSGIYLYKLEVGNFSEVRKMILLK